MLRTNPDVVLSKYDTLMTEAKKLSDVVLKKLLLLDSDRRISCLCDPQYYLFRLFLVFPQIYRCCALISGEEKAFQRGTIQSSWRDAYHEFSDSMRIVLDDPCLEKLRTRDQNLGNYLLKHNRVGHLLFDPTFMQNFAYQ